MDLFEQLSAGLGIFIVNDNVHPFFAASMAADNPAGPAPTTIIS